MLSAKEISFLYPGAGSNALNSCTLALQSNTFYLLIGANGSGKSTLLNLLAGLRNPTSGELLFLGKQLEGPDLLIPGNPDIGFVHQQP
ncbi:ATP-binding cassette domain-containing protein, partial [Chitinophagales bacterium]|nr:ATP-binding cassette domain-containing protein [Chitinophagales bacterium]